MSSNVRLACSGRRPFSFVFAVLAIGIIQSPTPAWSAGANDEILQRESAGDLAGARSLLEQAAEKPGNPAAASDLAKFLDRHKDPDRRAAYLKWASAESDPSKRQLALRQVVLLDFMAGRNSDLASDLEKFRAAGGSNLSLPAKAGKSDQYSTVLIPGPLSSFARMAALAPDLSPEDLLPALARNIATNGYEASGNEILQPTEYLRLMMRYVGQARELQALANSNKKIVIPACDSEETGNLLKVLGYRMRGSCGADIVLETVNPTRAFLTVDSGFPLTHLEQDLRANRRFELPYAPTPVPVLYKPDYWLSAASPNNKSDFLDAFTSDPALCRLYLGLSHVEHPVAEALRRQAGPAKLRLFGSVLDFYGGMFAIRNGVAVVPGSPRSWQSVIGVSPSNPGAFFEKLLTIDDGWLASYFDAISRVENPRVTAYLTQPERLKRFYDALRGRVTTPGPARPVFRSSTDIMLLTTSLRIDENGRPEVPGNLEVWRTLFIKHPHSKYDAKLMRAAAGWKTGDDLVEAMFALSRKTADNDPLKMFLAISDVDRGRSKPLSPELTALLINNYRGYGEQYRTFAEHPRLSEASMKNYIALCAEISGDHDGALRSDLGGIVQASVELWNILARQNSIGPNAQDEAFSKLTQTFVHVKTEPDLFTAGRSAVGTLLSAAHLNPSHLAQEELINAMVGKPERLEGAELPAPGDTFLRMFDAQQLIPLDALFTVADRLGKGDLDKKTARTINDQLSRMEEVQTLHASASRDERNVLATGYWTDKHVDQERKFNLDTILKNADKKDQRGALTPFLRDTLVGLLYCYYAPPGAEVLLTNPQFVRSHDFIGPESAPALWRTTEVTASGWPASTGGRLSGSLVSLPYALAQAEQNFLTPRKEQALIWGDLVPQVIMNVTVTRWRNVTPDQTRWVALHIERGRNLLATAALDPALLPRVLDSLGRLMSPAETERVGDHLRRGDYAEATAQLPPSYLFAMADDPRLKDAPADLSSLEIATMAARNEPDLTLQAISSAFGTPKPTLTHSYEPRLLYLRTFPALMGFSSRILAETWESNNLYYAALADEAGIPTTQLERQVREWNRAAIENIFATHLEDWPALIRSLNTTGENVRHRGNQRAGMGVLGN